MAALVQTYTPQQPGTVTMLQTRPSGGSQAGQQYGVPQSQRGSFHGLPGGAAGPAVYRSSSPIQPYAFTSTPSLNGTQWQQYGSRASSSPNLPTMRTFDQSQAGNRLRHTANSSVSNLTYSPSMGLGMTGSRDDSSITQARSITPTQRPQSAYMTGSSPQVSFAQATPVRASPDRYRRPGGQQPARPQNSAAPSGSGMGAVGHLYSPPSVGASGVRVPSAAGYGRPNSLYVPTTRSAVDDTQLYRQPSKDDARRLRRRSMHTLDSADYPNPLTPQPFRRPEERSRVEPSTTPKNGEKDTKTLRLVPNANAACENMRVRNGSSESLVSSRSSHSRPSSSANRNAPAPTGPPSSSHSSNTNDSSSKQDSPKLVTIPPRASSTDVGKRTLNPSPLSRPVTMANEDAAEEGPSSSVDERASTPVGNSSGLLASNGDSPAAKQLAAINKGAKSSKSKTSRLRRAFSFSSAAELKKAADAAQEGDKPEPAKLHKEPNPNELYDAEQARIAKKQEEGGIGSSIYGARIFAGSTDNLSISSTASSASIMIRKMGRGMKKSTRSLVGLFRPKSIVGAPSAEGLSPAPSPAPAEPTATAVSMITVEAERELVNVNADPHLQPGGGTGFPHLERNSIDASKAPSIVSERVGSSGTDNSGPRKSIVGGDKERAEVLAAVRKGILKKGSSSPIRAPAENVPATDVPGVPAISDSPNSSAPSTPNDEAQGHKRSDSVAIGSEDYFVSALRLRQDTKSAPGTPPGTKRNATFSPRLVFFDTWPSQEYDRRGDIATCNRLTPMLAQQIKEELNTFKMEMEVHENSKIYTHFF